MKNQSLKETSIAEIVSQNPGSIKVFEKFNIDYCCNGKLNFEEACRRANVGEESVMEELNAAAITDTLPGSIRPQSWSLGLLANYIVQNHHAYVKKVTPEIMFLLNKVCNAHGAKHPELFEIKQQFEVVSEELSTHMYKEEAILFPAIGDLTVQGNTYSSSEKKNQLGFKLKYPIDTMEKEHEQAGQCLSKMSELSDDYSLPAGVCNSYKLLYKRLQEFEEDLHIHIHLENNILFPKAIELESRLEEAPACAI